MSDSSIHIGNDKESVEAVSSSIVNIFKAAHENHIEQETIRAAFGAFSSLSETRNASISNCSFVSGSKVDTEPSSSFDDGED